MDHPNIVWDPRERYLAVIEQRGAFVNPPIPDAASPEPPDKPQLRVYELGGAKRVSLR